MCNMKALSLMVKKLWPMLKFSKVGQTSRSRSRGQKLWYHVKGLVSRNTFEQYQSPITSGKKVMAKVNFFKVGQTSRSRSQSQKVWCHVKGLVTRNTHVQYESLISSGKKVMAKVNIFVHAYIPTRTRTLTPTPSRTLGL